MPSHSTEHDASPIERHIAARIKVINPLMSTGPSTAARVLSLSDTCLKLLVSRAILAGSMIQLRISKRVVFGRVRCCIASGNEFEIMGDVTQVW
jgi:hypothetical protein